MNSNFDRNNKNNYDLVSMMKQMPFFKEFKKSELRQFSKILYIRWYDENEIIYTENDPGIGMFFIYKGTVKIFKNSELNGREQLSTLLENDFLGEASLLQNSPRSATAIALENCCLLGLFRPDLMRFVERKPRLGNKILLKLADCISTRLKQKDEELLQIKEKLSNSDIIQ